MFSYWDSKEPPLELRRAFGPTRKPRRKLCRISNQNLRQGFFRGSYNLRTGLASVTIFLIWFVRVHGDKVNDLSRFLREFSNVMETVIGELGTERIPLSISLVQFVFASLVTAGLITE